jgi:hypothetical protein
MPLLESFVVGLLPEGRDVFLACFNRISAAMKRKIMSNFDQYRGILQVACSKATGVTAVKVLMVSIVL